jgi:hypothetical protein
MPNPGQLLEILGIEGPEDRSQFLLEATCGQQSAVRLRRRGEAIEDADAAWLERAKQLTQRCVLAADAAQIANGDVREIQGEGGGGDRNCHSGCLAIQLSSIDDATRPGGWSAKVAV